MIRCVLFHFYCCFFCFMSTVYEKCHIGLVETSSDHQCKIDWYLHWSSLPLHLPSSQVENRRTDWDFIFVKHKSSLSLYLADFVLGMVLVVLTLSGNLSVLGDTGSTASGCIPEHLTEFERKSDQSFSLLCWWYLRHGAHGVDPKCWLVDSTDLGIIWPTASGWIPKQLTQVIPKSDQSFSLLWWWYLRHGAHGIDPKCWLVDLTDLGIIWPTASGWIPKQLTQVIPKSDLSFSLLCWWYLSHGVPGVDPKCWLVDKTDLGIKWVIMVNNQ